MQVRRCTRMMLPLLSKPYLDVRTLVPWYVMVPLKAIHLHFVFLLFLGFSIIRCSINRIVGKYVMGTLQPSEKQLAGVSKWVRALSVNSPPTADRKKTKQGDQYVCPICSEVIIEDNDTDNGQDAIYCDSTCDTWLHHQCASISKLIFESLKNSNKPFYCMYFHLTSYESQFSEFKSTISQLQNTVLKLERKLAKTSQT